MGDGTGSIAISSRERVILLAFARRVIETHLTGRVEPVPDASVSETVRALQVGLFVTLRLDGALRGCIGHIEPRGRILDEIRAVAVAAAVQDHRFPPVAAGEMDRVRLELSLLTPPRPALDPTRIQLGTDGVILTAGAHSAVFLPEVATEQRWSLVQMLEALSRKARLAPDAWRGPEARFEVFQSVHFEEAP